MHYLTACLFFKDAAFYLDEWIRFHRRVGIEHFYLYDNDSDDNYEKVVRPFVERGEITLHKWSGIAQQVPALRHCLNQHRGEARWIAFVDDDEFLFPAVESDLRAVLPRYEPYAGVAVSWLLFGSNGHWSRPGGLVIENYLRRADWVDPHVKCIIDPSRVVMPAALAHAFHCMPNETIVDENLQPMAGPFCPRPSADVFCLNHYVIKSHEEMVRRRTRPKADGAANNLTIAQWEEFDAQYNTIEDLRIQRFAKDLIDK